MSFHENKDFLQNILIRKPIKTLENDDFYIKIIDFDQICKKNHLAVGPLPGVTLGGGHASGGPLRGG